MARKSLIDVAELAWNAGFRGSELNRAVAVAYAESTGNTNAVSSTGCCHGLWQINVRVHGSTKGWTVEQMRDPQQNANAAYTLWKESGWHPWDSSRGGQLLWRLPADNAVSAFLATNPKDIGPNVLGAAADSLVPGRGAPDALTAIGNLAQFFTVGRNWARIGEIAIGGILLILALSILAKPIVKEIPTPKVSV